MMDKLIEFGKLFVVPEFALPYLNYFVSGREMDIVLAFGQEHLTVGEASRRLKLSEAATGALLEKLYQACVLNREAPETARIPSIGKENPPLSPGGDSTGPVLPDEEKGFIYSISDFYAKLDYQCKFGTNYLDIPKQVRDALDVWCYEIYRERTLPYIKQLEEHEPVRRVPETYELLENLDEFIERSHTIRLVPCNCRMLAQNCERPTGTCLGFDGALTDRTGGKPLSKEEAKEIVRMAHKKGLMHQVNSDWRAAGPQWMCNCCACCCYPLRLSRELGSKGLFPPVQYVARHDEEACTHCGACAKRCHFQAFHLEGGTVQVNGQDRQRVALDPDKCYGCGICQSTCPAGAIAMIKA